VYPIVDADLLRGRSAAAVVAAALAGGGRIVQVRAKTAADAAFLALAREAVAAARGGGAALLVNDRPDVALLAGAGGVHLGQDDLAPADARRVLPAGSILGLSTHDDAQVEAADREPIDYVAVGPVFATRTKRDPHPAIGLAGVRSARARTRLPLVAIGGIDADTAAAVIEAGADGVAVVSAVLAEDDVAAAVRRLRAAIGDTG
jgi:thiamine-phosphate pyrophosphorylase